MLRYNVAMFDYLWTPFIVLYAISATAYLLHCTAVWMRWPHVSRDTAPLWMRANLCWVFAGSGFFPLTNGRIISHLGLALTPGVNTVFLAMQLGYVLVSIAEQIWALHVRAWWNRPVHVH